jgi:hypothetical protein
MLAEYALSQHFWRQFKTKNWDAELPTVLKRPFQSQILKEDEIFSGLLEYRRRVTEGDLSSFHFYAGTERVGKSLLDLHRWLPLDGERTFQEYLKRVTAQVEGRGFCANICGFHRFVGFDFWNRLRSFLSGFDRGVGVPAGAVSADLFFGDYRMTPFGVHRDPSSVFSFALQGTKKIRTWPLESFSSEHVGNYRLKLGESTLHEAQQGDVIFWPSSSWHVGEGDGSSAVSLSLCLGHGSEPLLDILRKALIESTQRSPGTIGDVCAQLAYLKGVLSDRKSPALDKNLIRALMERATSFGLLPPTIPPATQTDSGIAFKKSDGFQILFRRCEEVLVVAAEGRSFELPYSRSLERLLSRLNRNEIISRDFSGDDEIDSNLCRILLKKLIHLKAVIAHEEARYLQ